MKAKEFSKVILFMANRWNEETAKARFETYFRETAPLIDYYKSRNVLKTINAEGSIDEVWARLLEVID